MKIDTDEVISAALLAKHATGENFLALVMEIDVDTKTAKWRSYTPLTNHTKMHQNFREALADTITASTDAGKLIKQAEVFEFEAQRLRQRAGVSK